MREEGWKIIIVATSDTHGHLVEVPDGDVLIHAGDATRVGSAKQIEELNEWFGRQMHKHKILVAGNHDFLFERDGEVARKYITNAVYLQDQMVTIDGINIYGSPWVPRFFDWAFMKSRQELESVWDRIPDDVDVLVTHGPPGGILDRVGAQSVGCSALRQRLDGMRKPPRLHVFGHIHEGYGTLQGQRTLFVNACACNKAHDPINPPFRIGINKSGALQLNP